jgi:ferritin-like protein
MSHEGYHEQPELLPEPTKDLHRAILSLMEELEAIDWYQQRADASNDEALKAVMLHNRNEEVEHAMMTLEWIRRRDAKFDETARTYLFTQIPITEVEDAAKAAGGAEKPAAKSSSKPSSKPFAEPSAHSASLGIGSLRSNP